MYSYLYCLLILITLFGCSSSIGPVEEEQPERKLSMLEETNIWIYRYMNHRYLWRDDIPDSISCDFSKTPTSFFESLLSHKDRFSYVGFSSRSVNSNNYGFAYQKVHDKLGKEYWAVLYTISSEAKHTLKRGMLLSPNYLTDSYGIFSIVDNESGLVTNQDVILSAKPYTRAAANNTVYIDSIYTLAKKKIAYLCYLQFDDAHDFFSSINKFAENKIDELVLDLRYNPGGYERTCKTLCNALVNQSAYGQIFVKHSYNKLVAAENKAMYGDECTYEYYQEPFNSNTPILGEVCSYLDLKRIYILTSSHSASCSELSIISLRPFMDVIVIGENSTGKGVGMQATSIPNFNYMLVPITFQFYNALDETVPENGIVPDIYVPDGYLTSQKQLGEIEEPLLNAALQNILGKHSKGVNLCNYDCAHFEPMGDPSFLSEFKQNCNTYEN